jgi:TolA-binding protein
MTRIEMFGRNRVWMRFVLPLLAVVCLVGCGKPTPEELLQEGLQMNQQQNFSGARSRFEQVLKEYPDYELVPDVRILIADCFNHEGSLDDARVIYEEILEKYPDSAHSWMAHIRLGDMARLDEEWDQAEEFFNAAIKDTTDTNKSLKAMHTLAQTFMEAENPDRAIETYKEMLGLAETPVQRLQTAQILTNLHFSVGNPDEAWVSIVDVYDASYSYPILNQYFTSVMETARSLKKYDEGFKFFDSTIDGTTDEEKSSLSLYFKGHLACSTAVYRATGVATLKEVHERFPKTALGRWAPSDAAVVIVKSSDEFANPITEASALFELTLHNYDDIINDMTTEWYYPEKAVSAWRQVAKAHELRGVFLESVDDLKAASQTHAEVVSRFKDYLPRVAENSRAYVNGLTEWVAVAEASPEEFWDQARMFRMGRPMVAEATPEADLDAPDGETLPPAIGDATEELVEQPGDGEGERPEPGSSP